jgi:hypothetical protein
MRARACAGRQSCGFGPSSRFAPVCLPWPARAGRSPGRRRRRLRLQLRRARRLSQRLHLHSRHLPRRLLRPPEQSPAGSAIRPISSRRSPSTRSAPRTSGSGIQWTSLDSATRHDRRCRPASQTPPTRSPGSPRARTGSSRTATMDSLSTLVITLVSLIASVRRRGVRART